MEEGTKERQKGEERERKKKKPSTATNTRVNGQITLLQILLRFFFFFFVFFSPSLHPFLASPRTTTAINAATFFFSKTQDILTFNFISLAWGKTGLFPTQTAHVCMMHTVFSSLCCSALFFFSSFFSYKDELQVYWCLHAAFFLLPFSVR